MSILRKIFDILREHYEHQPSQAWWPEDPLEVVVGAVLVQGATWKSVDRVLAAMREHGLLDFARIRDIDSVELETVIRSVGFQTKKARRLKDLAGLFLDRFDGNLERFFARDVNTVRKELLSVQGIGPGTADNIMLYAGGLPIYMVDSYTARLLQRHGIVGLTAKESDIQRLIHQELTPDEEPYGTKLFCDFQSLVVRLGRDFCDKSRPACDVCPLVELLPPEGAVGVGDNRLSIVEHHLPTRKHHPELLGTAPVSLPELQPIEELTLDERERKIVERIGDRTMPIDELIAAAELPAHLVRATIAMLEMRRIVQQVEGNMVRRRRSP